jgi:hypothetical protein
MVHHMLYCQASLTLLKVSLASISGSRQPSRLPPGLLFPGAGPLAWAPALLELVPLELLLLELLSRDDLVFLPGAICMIRQTIPTN